MKSYREELCESLTRLAAPASDQINYLKGLMSYPSIDELALDLHELALLAEQRRREGKLSPREQAAIKLIDDKLDTMSGPQNAALWTTEALSSAPEWQAVRDLSEETLQLMRDESRH